MQPEKPVTETETPPRAGKKAFVSPTHKRTEGLAPVWGSEFNDAYAICVLVRGAVLPSGTAEPIRNSYRSASNFGTEGTKHEI